MKKKVVVGVFSAFLLIAGCSSNEESEKETPKVEQEKQAEVIPSKQDEDLSKKMLKEKIVKDGQVYIQGDTVVAAFIVKDKIKEKQINTFANDYAKQLKKKYPDLKVIVHATQEDELKANITLD